MELKVSSVKPEGLSPVECSSDPEEKEVSEEDDDDRNHKHRRRESHSQSMERDSLEPVFTRPYRKRNKPFENGHPYREFESQASENWKNHSTAPLGKDFTSKFEKRRPGLVSLSRSPLDLNPRFRPNQTFSGELGSGRGRGWESGSWSQRDSRFSSADIASQMVHQGSITPNLFGGRGLANVSNAQSASWNTYGLIPGIPNGGLDPLHSIALQGTLGPAVNSSLHMGIHRQRCRDFEERGFCLRGDMCPMEHGINRIVIEDVQSLSQFNLPVSLTSAQLVGPNAVPANLPSVGAPSATMMNSKGMHSKTSKAGVVDDDSLGLNGAYSSSVSGADLYDPDQPLWNDGPETSTALLALHSPKNDENESLVSADPSDRHHASVRGTDNGTGRAVGSQSTSSSVWGRIRHTDNKLDAKEKTDPAVSSADYLEADKEGQDALASARGTFRQGKRIIAEGVFSRTSDSSAKIHGDAIRNTRKPSQKALRTLFVNGIPQKSNKREALLAHFQKFGEIVDIYIPSNSERAFVQFSKREEAEAALRAPDAVMGNRFIKLWWANRDSIPEDGMTGSSSLSVTPRGITAAVPPHLPPGNNSKDILQPATPKGTANATISDASLPAPEYPKPAIANGPKVPPPLQKKLESLEQLKEELRKKQELLDQKRNDFRQKLVKLEKQATGVKADVVTEPAAKKHKVEISANAAKTTSDVSLQCTEVIADKSNTVENASPVTPKTNSAVVLQEAKGTKQPIHSLALVPAGSPFLMNRYKLDNRPTAFRIVPPLPAGLANVAALKEHFSSHGDISTVEIEDIEPCDAADASEMHKNCTARVNFTTRQSAEWAFLNGKYWQGHNLKFMWVTPTTSSNESGGRENSAAPNCPIDADGPSAKVLASMDSREASATGNEEPEVSEKNSDADFVGLLEVSEPHSASGSGEKESTDHKHSPNSVSGGEESTKKETSPAAMSPDRDSPTGVVC